MIVTPLRTTAALGLDPLQGLPQPIVAHGIVDIAAFRSARRRSKQMRQAAGHPPQDCRALER
jgi:hypothetical protein